MKKFIDLQEKPKTIAFTFGRFNPPTIGHEKLLTNVKSVQILVIILFYGSLFDQNPKKDPLQYVRKLIYMRQSFPKHKRNIVVSKGQEMFLRY